MYIVFGCLVVWLFGCLVVCLFARFYPHTQSTQDACGSDPDTPRIPVLRGRGYYNNTENAGEKLLPDTRSSERTVAFGQHVDGWGGGQR